MDCGPIHPSPQLSVNNSSLFLWCGSKILKWTKTAQNNRIFPNYLWMMFKHIFGLIPDIFKFCQIFGVFRFFLPKLILKIISSEKYICIFAHSDLWTHFLIFPNFSDISDSFFRSFILKKMDTSSKKIKCFHQLNIVFNFFWVMSSV